MVSPALARASFDGVFARSGPFLGGSHVWLKG